jgi:hypothetical protein
VLSSSEWKQQFSRLTCFAEGGSVPRVYYVDGHVNELAWDGSQWKHTDVTARAGGPSPVGIPTDVTAITGALPLPSVS